MKPQLDAVASFIDLTGSEKSRMAVVQFRKNLLHDRLTEKHRLGRDMEFVAIQLDSRHFTVIEIDDLAIPTAQSLLLLLQIFRVNWGMLGSVCQNTTLLNMETG